MTKNAQAQRLIQEFEAVAESDFTSAGIEAFQRKVHIRFPQEFDFHFLLIMLGL